MSAIETHTNNAASAELTTPDHASPADVDAARRPSRRRWLIVGGVVVLVVAAAAVAVTAGGGDDGEAAEVTPRRAVEATTQDLVEFDELDGTLTYPSTAQVGAATEGVVTSVTADGDRLDPGAVVYEVDARPVTLVAGDVPPYRVLESGTEGDDVRQFEAHLASLGYHAELDDDGDEIDEGFLVDGVFDAATTEAVIRWQEDLGLPETGVVAPGDIVVASGPVVVSDVLVEPGSRVATGTPVLSLSVLGESEAFHVSHAGDVELVAEPGATIASGQVLYAVDDEPILAVVTDADVELDRDLGPGVADGEDVEVLEQMLVDAGFDVAGTLDVDEELDDVTAEAIEDLWESLDGTYDLDVTDVVRADQLVIVEPGTVVGTPTTHDGAIASGAELFSTTSGSEARVVTSAIAVDEQDRLPEGGTVDIELPGGEVVTGTVTQVAVSSVTDPTDPTAEPMLPVEVTVDAVPSDIAALNEVEVTVLVVDELIEGAVTVPVTALVATGGGGHAVEVVSADGLSTTFVAVEPGRFADGMVEVDGIEAGTAVVVPS